MKFLIRLALAAAAVFVCWFAVERFLVTHARPGLHYTMQAPQATSSSIVQLGEADAGSANEYAWRVEALSITPTSAVLRVQVARFPDMSPMARLRAIEAVAPQQLTYKVCDRLTIPVDKGAPLVLSGFTESPCRR